MAKFNIIEQYRSYYANIEAKLPTILPYGSDYSWEQDFEDAITQQIAENVCEAVTEILKEYSDTIIVEDYESDEKIPLTLTVDDFHIEVKYTDNGYYGADLEITVYNNFRNRVEDFYFTEGEAVIYGCAHWLEEQLSSQLDIDELRMDAFDEHSHLCVLDEDLEYLV